MGQGCRGARGKSPPGGPDPVPNPPRRWPAQAQAASPGSRQDRHESSSLWGHDGDTLIIMQCLSFTLAGDLRAGGGARAEVLEMPPITRLPRPRSTCGG
jgi:hypothetical protein